MTGVQMTPELAHELAHRYYRLALSKAAQRDLSGAAQFARRACTLDESHENAARLLNLCLHELGVLSAGPEDEIKQISDAVQQRKWRKALRLAKALPQRSVRVLNIQACLYACARKHKKATQAFAKAQEKDTSNQLAIAGLGALGRSPAIIFTSSLSAHLNVSFQLKTSTIRPQNPQG